MGNVKLLGMLGATALALVSFLGTSSASAAAQFTAGGAGETLSTNTIEQHVFTITGGDVECDTTSFTGTSFGKEASEQTLTPTYAGCEAFGFAGAIVSTNGCEFALKAGTSGEHATLALAGCGSGTAEDKTKGIQISLEVPFFATCIVDIPEQSIEKAVRYSNAAGGMNIEFTMSKMMTDVTTSIGFCPLTTGTHSGASGGTYEGESRVLAAGGTITSTEDEISGSTAFTAGGAGETLSDTTIKDHIFTLGGIEIECDTIDFTGTTAGKEMSQQTVSPAYDDCTALGSEAEVFENGCEITFKAATTGSPGHATAALTGCGSGTAEDKTKGIQVSVEAPFATCVVDIPEQSLGTAVSYSQSVAKNVNVNITATGIMVDVTVSTGICALILEVGTHSGANGGGYRGVSSVTTVNGISHSP
jgi:PII-like signaling protein